MPKLPFKRKAADDSASLSAYIPAQMVDYTALPPLEEDTPLVRFKRLPVFVRIGAILLPILLLAGAGFGIWQMLNQPVVEAAPPLPPSMTITEARAVSKDAINVEATVENAPNGATATGKLVQGDQPLAWADPASSTATVTNGKVSLRMVKAADAVALDATAPYTVELTLGTGADAVFAQKELDVAEKLRGVFFAAAVEPTPAPTSEPTSEPTAAPTAEPTPAPPTFVGPPMVETTVQASLLISPTLGTAPVAAAPEGTRFEPLLRTPDNAWYLVQQGDNVGWLNADQVLVDAAARDQIALVTPKDAEITVGPALATVGNGGNIRFRPNTKSGTVLGQLHAGQSITMTGRSSDGQWALVVAPAARGWVSVTLLEYDDAAFGALPVTDQPAVQGTAGSGSTSNVSAPTTAQSSGENPALRTALQRTSEMKSGRFEFTLKGKVPLGTMPVSASQQNMTLVTLNGETNGSDIRVTLGGMVTPFLGITSASTLDVLYVNNQMYLRGPLTLPGGEEDRWYELKGSMATAMQSSPVEQTARDELLKSVDLSMFTKTGSEQLNGRTCDVYSADKLAVLNWLNSLGTWTGPDAEPTLEEQLKNVDIRTLALNLSVCDDGYLYQIKFAMDMTDKQQNQNVVLDMNVRLYDHNAPVAITAPADAAPLDTGDFDAILRDLENR